MAQLELRRHVGLYEQNQRMLKEHQDNLEGMNAMLQKQSVTDDVTGFNNTRFLYQYLDQYMSSTSAGVEKLTLVFFDMDNFKQVVDDFGHMHGSKVLKEVAEVVHTHLDNADRIVRYGGDEFIVILPGQSGEKALSKVEAIKEAIGSTVYLQKEKINLEVTASFGLATFPDDARDKKQLLMAADQCLFQSKKRGKNKISIWRLLSK